MFFILFNDLNFFCKLVGCNQDFQKIETNNPRNFVNITFIFKIVSKYATRHVSNAKPKEMFCLDFHFSQIYISVDLLAPLVLHIRYIPSCILRYIYLAILNIKSNIDKITEIV